MSSRRTIMVYWNNTAARIFVADDTRNVIPDIIAYLRNLRDQNPDHEVHIHPRGHSPRTVTLQELEF